MDLLAQMEYLFAGFAVFWAGLLVYLVMLQARLRALRDEVSRLEERLGESRQVTTATPERGRAIPNGAPGVPPSQM